MHHRMLLLSALLVLRAMASGAHAVGVSRGEYRAEGAQVRADLVFARKELLTALPNLDADRDGDLSSGEIEHARGELSEWVRRGIVVRVWAGSCAGGLEGAGLTEQDGVELAAVYQCPRQATAFSVRLGLLAELSLGHRHLVSATSPSQTVRTVLYEGQPELELAPSSPVAGQRGSVGPSLFRLGVRAGGVRLVSGFGGRVWFAGRGGHVACSASSACGWCWFVGRVRGCQGGTDSGYRFTASGRTLMRPLQRHEVQRWTRTSV